MDDETVTRRWIISLGVIIVCCITGIVVDILSSKIIKKYRNRRKVKKIFGKRTELDYCLLRFGIQTGHRCFLTSRDGRSWHESDLKYHFAMLNYVDDHFVHDVLILKSENGSFIFGISCDSTTQRKKILHHFLDKNTAQIVVEYIFPRYCFFPKPAKESRRQIKLGL